MISKLINYAKHVIYCLADDYAESMNLKMDTPSNEEAMMLAIARLEQRVEELEKRL